MAKSQKNPRKIFEQINKVEGLNINDLATIIQGADGNDYKLLKVKDRTSWYKMIYPKGQIVTELIHINDNMAVVKASIIDEDGKILATGHGEAFNTPDSPIEKYYVGCAETKAVGRALGFAGFGNQFDEDDDIIPDAGVPVKKATESSEPENLFDAILMGNDEKQKEFEARVENMMNTLTPKMSKGVVISYGPAQNYTISDVYKNEKNEDKLFTLRQYAYPESKDVDEKHISVIAACRTFIKGIEESAK